MRGKVEGNMRKTSIELSEDQYFFLKERVLDMQRTIPNATVVSIIRDLIEKERQKWLKGKKK